MRFMLPLFLAAMLLVPAAMAGEVQPTIAPMHGCEEDPDPEIHCHDDKESPGVGALALVGMLGAAALLRRRS